MPFYPTADRDDGYDITDFYGVDPRLGTFGRLRRAGADLPIARHPGDHRLRHEPHLGPASVVPRGPRSSRGPRTATGTCGALPLRRTRRSRWCSPTWRTASGNWTRSRGVLPAPLLQDPARPQPREPEVRDEMAAPWVSGSSSASPASASTPYRSSSPRTSCRGASDVPAVRPARLPAQPADLHRATGRRSGAPRRGQRALQGPTRSSSVASDGDELSMQFDFIGMQAIYLSMARGDARPLARRSRRRPDSTRPTSGRTSCATTTSSPWTSSPRRSGRRSSTRSAPTRTCSSSVAGCGAGSRRCSAATCAGSRWPTR